MRRGRKSGCGLRVAFVIERARGVHHGRRDRPPIGCRSAVLRTPFGRLAAPTPLAQRASLLAGTASDVRAPWRPVCVSHAFHRVTQRSKPRDGLFGQVHASLRPAQRRSPSDPPNGSSPAPASALRESWVNDFRAGSSRRNAARRQQKRRAALASSKASSTSTMIYAKADVESLRTAALNTEEVNNNG